MQEIIGDWHVHATVWPRYLTKQKFIHLSQSAGKATNLTTDNSVIEY